MVPETQAYRIGGDFAIAPIRFPLPPRFSRGAIRSSALPSSSFAAKLLTPVPAFTTVLLAHGERGGRIQILLCRHDCDPCARDSPWRRSLLPTRARLLVHGTQMVPIIYGGGLRHTLASHGCCSRGNPVGR